MDPQGSIWFHFYILKSYIWLTNFPSFSLGTIWNPLKDHWWSPDHRLKTPDLEDCCLLSVNYANSIVLQRVMDCSATYNGLFWTVLIMIAFAMAVFVQVSCTYVVLL